MPTLAERLRRLSTSALADALGKRGALAPEIRRLSGDGVAAGPARTAICAPRSASATFGLLAEAGEGDVLCLQGPGIWAYFGEITGAEAVRRGVAGVVVDGWVRDLDALRALGLSVFARGATPVGGSFGGRGEVGIALELSGQRLEPGDWIVGDSDGVLVVPAGEGERAAAEAEAIALAEAETLARVAAGDSVLDAPFRGGRTVEELIAAGAEP